MGSLATDMSTNDPPDRLDELYRLHRRRVVAVAAHLLGERAGAEDIAQEAFIQLAAHLDEVKEPGAWLRTVTYRRALNELRRRERERNAFKRHSNGQTQTFPADLIDPADVRLADALGRLSGNQRAASLLCWVDELSASEAAQIIGCTAATVRVHLHRARKALARDLEEEQS